MRKETLWKVVWSIFVFVMLFQIQTSNALTLRECITASAEKFGIDEELLVAIAYVESSFNPYAVNVNRNGTRDLGMFQINEANLRAWGIDEEYAFNPCTASFLAGYVLKQCINRYGYTWKAVDCYNKGRKAKPDSRYVKKVKQVLRRIIND